VALAGSAAIKVYQDPRAPLTKTADDGSAVDVLFWTFRDLDGWPVIVVHPDRWDAFQAAFAERPTPPPVAESGAKPAGRAVAAVPVAIRGSESLPTMTTVCAQEPGTGANGHLHDTTGDGDSED
jgi:hypothetical protein